MLKVPQYYFFFNKKFAPVSFSKPVQFALELIVRLYFYSFDDIFEIFHNETSKYSPGFVIVTL